MEPRLTLVTLGVSELAEAFAFYKDVLELPSKDGITGDVAFFQLKGVWLGLYPRDLLAKDAGVVDEGKGFPGITLAHNVTSKGEVGKLIERVRAAGATIVKEPQDTEWGGYHGYFKDPDGYLWEIAYNPHFWVE